jgi:hypothetical protein
LILLIKPHCLYLSAAALHAGSPTLTYIVCRPPLVRRLPPTGVFKRINYEAATRPRVGRIRNEVPWQLGELNGWRSGLARPLHGLPAANCWRGGCSCNAVIGRLWQARDGPIGLPGNGAMFPVAMQKHAKLYIRLSLKRNIRYAFGLPSNHLLFVGILSASDWNEQSLRNFEPPFSNPLIRFKS